MQSIISILSDLLFVLRNIYDLSASLVIQYALKHKSVQSNPKRQISLIANDRRIFPFFEWGIHWLTQSHKQWKIVKMGHDDKILKDRFFQCQSINITLPDCGISFILWRIAEDLQAKWNKKNSFNSIILATVSRY